MQRADHDQWKSSEVARLLALVESERRYYQDIFAALPVPIALVDRELRLVAVNRAFRFTFNLIHEDFSKMRLPDLLPDAALESALAQAAITGLTGPAIALNVAGEAGPRRFEVSVRRLAGYQAGADDELLLTFEQAATAPAQIPAPEPPPSRGLVEQAKRGAIERLSSRLAHVCNNLLMIIGGYSGELLDSLAEADPRRADVAEIVCASDRLSALTRDLTALTRPPIYETTSFGLARWAQTIEERLRDYKLASGAVDKTAVAHTSPVLLEQIVFEAARYLAPHLGEQGLLRLSIEAVPDARLRLTLTVEKATLADEVAERIFEPFSGDKAGADPPLGLAGLIRPWTALNGAVEFTPPNFVLTLPQASAQTIAPSKATILLVEDEPGIRSLIVKALERGSYRVLEAATPAGALTLLSEQPAPADLLLTDLMIPGMSGGALATEVRTQWPGVKVLFISGYTSDPDLARQIGEGSLPPDTRFLAKPFTTAQLIAEVAALVG